MRVKLLQVVAVAVVAILAALFAVFGTMALRDGVWPAGRDALGFAAAIALTGAVLVTALHWPALGGLRRRGVALGPWPAGLVAALGLNAPVYAVLAVIGRDRSLFARDEAAFLGLGFAVIGWVFGAGYATIHRQPAARG